MTRALFPTLTKALFGPDIRDANTVRQSYRNDQQEAVYVSVEPWPEYFKLEPGEELTMVWEKGESDNLGTVALVNECEVIIYPEGKLDEMTFLIDGKDAEGRSWDFTLGGDDKAG